MRWLVVLALVLGCGGIVEREGVPFESHPQHGLGGSSSEVVPEPNETVGDPEGYILYECVTEAGCELDLVSRDGEKVWRVRTDGSIWPDSRGAMDLCVELHGGDPDIWRWRCRNLQ